MTIWPRLAAWLLSLHVAFGCATASDPSEAPRAPVLPGRTYAVRDLSDPATPERCAARRARTVEALGDGLLVVGAGGGPGRFLAANDFYWLTGVASPDAVLVLTADLERLYLHPRNENWERWNGPRLSPGEEAAHLTGIADTRPLTELAADLARLAQLPGVAGTVFVSEVDFEGTAARELLAPLQAVKDPGELAAMRAAIDITQEALIDALRHALPDTYEFETEARIEAGFRARGAEGLAFPTICGSGPNSCTLHYRANERRMRAGDLLVMDVGAKFRHYCADVTRTIPVDGRFTPRQREIYTHVYVASREAARVLRPGASLDEAHGVARDYLREHGYDGYFLHGVGHGLGLLVHDEPSFRDPLAAGMVVTIEPGIYIAAEELGVRIEDDYLITETGAELLSDRIPADPDELEAFLEDLRSAPESR